MSENNFRKGPHASKNKPTVADVEILADGAVSSADERKTVVLDEDLEGVEFEDRVWLYWKRNKNFIIMSIAAAFAIIIGVQGYKIYAANAKAELANAYASAQSADELAKFAEQNSGKKLAGVALLQNADKLFADGKFSEAQTAYENAGKDLKKTVLEGRALVGAAASAGAQDASKGIEAFAKVAADKSLDAVYSAQANYLLGLYYAKAGKTAEAKTAFKTALDNKGAGYFGRMAEMELSKLD